MKWSTSKQFYNLDASKRTWAMFYPNHGTEIWQIQNTTNPKENFLVGSKQMGPVTLACLGQVRETHLHREQVWW
jgi:hypothetical protein